jgi:hypothetical protein
MDIDLIKQYELLHRTNAQHAEGLRKAATELENIQRTCTQFIADMKAIEQQQQTVENDLTRQVSQLSGGTLCVMKTSDVFSGDISTMQHQWTFKEILMFLELHQVAFFTNTMIDSKTLVFALFPTDKISLSATDPVLAAIVNTLVKLVNIDKNFNMMTYQASFCTTMPIQHTLMTVPRTGRLVATKLCPKRCNFCSKNLSPYDYFSIEFGNLDVVKSARKRIKCTDDDDD